MELDFQTTNKYYAKYRKIYLDIMGKAFKYLKLKADPIVSVSFVDEDFIHELNKNYRNIDRVTDVISFAFLDTEENKQSILKKKQPVVLGDIYICLQRAKDQAKEYGHPLDRELRFLFTHGLLHLLGYDHMKKEDEEIMFPLQEKILFL